MALLPETQNLQLAFVYLKAPQVIFMGRQHWELLLYNMSKKLFFLGKGV